MRRAAELGDPEAQGQLAQWYLQGECSLPANYKEALRLAGIGATQSNTLSMRQLGNLYIDGLGVAKDLDEACKWYRQAAALGNDAAKAELRILAREGHEQAGAALRELGLRG